MTDNSHKYTYYCNPDWHDGEKVPGNWLLSRHSIKTKVEAACCGDHLANIFRLLALRGHGTRTNVIFRVEEISEYRNRIKE